MNEQVEQTSQTLDYETIRYGETINAGNFQNRKYEVEVKPNGKSFEEVIAKIKTDIQQQESLHEQAKTLREKLQAAKCELECLKSNTQYARITFNELERLLFSAEESPSSSNDGSFKLRDFKNRFEVIKGSFDSLEKQLGITRQSGYDEDILQTDDDEDDIPL